MNRTVTFTGKFGDEACVNIPSSKSYVHRMAICAALANGRSIISNVNFSNDITATLDCLNTLGCGVKKSENEIVIDGGSFSDGHNTYYCGESASTLRFMIPVVLAVAGGGRFIGSETLMKRPLDSYLKLFDENGIKYEYEAGKFLSVEGTFSKDEYSLDGGVSSQFVTGMLLALAYTGGRKRLNITGSMSSAPYVDITREVMAQFGVKAELDGNGFTIDGTNGFIPQNGTAQGDYSQSAFFIAAALEGGKIRLKNLSSETAQGDSAIIGLAEKMGGRIEKNGSDIIVYKSNLHSVGTIDGADFPDIVPPLALICTQCAGDTVITNVSRLKIKESNRLTAVENLLNTLGADVKTDDNNIYIKGGAKLCGGTVSAVNDHRIAMTAAAASVMASGSVTIEESESVNKSYPNFFDDFEKLGGVIIE